MKSLIEDIEMCITKVENDEEIYCFGWLLVP
jgi:hypothetical protein